jgi:hypothetical protein
VSGARGSLSLPAASNPALTRETGSDSLFQGDAVSLLTPSILHRILAGASVPGICTTSTVVQEQKQRVAIYGHREIRADVGHKKLPQLDSVLQLDRYACETLKLDNLKVPTHLPCVKILLRQTMAQEDHDATSR